MKKIIRILLLTLLVWTHLNAKEMLIIDVSGSIEPHAKEVKQMVHQYLENHTMVLAFASKPYFIKNEDELSFEGSTALSLALEKVQSLRMDFITIVTDGSPDNVEKSTAMAKKLKDRGTKICAVYVGEGLKVPKVFSVIADKTFAINQFKLAVSRCTEAREQLIGIEAMHKSVNIDKFVF